MATYVEDKYGFRFPFDENNPALHESEFGCCGFWNVCSKEGFCVIPEKISDGKKFCALAKRDGFNKLGAVKKTIKTVNFRKYDSKRG